MNPALIESAVGTAGYGASSAGPGGESGVPWKKLLGAGVAAMGETASQDTAPIDTAPLEQYHVDEYRDPGRMLSDKGVKRPAKGGVQQAMARGIRRENPIDENGVEMLRIQELTKQVKQLEAAIKARRKKGKR